MRQLKLTEVEITCSQGANKGQSWNLNQVLTRYKFVKVRVGLQCFSRAKDSMSQPGRWAPFGDVIHGSLASFIALWDLMEGKLKASYL